MNDFVQVQGGDKEFTIVNDEEPTKKLDKSIHQGAQLQIPAAHRMLRCAAVFLP